ncbi:hypothetical protein EMGBS3_15900 [Anaerolineaceae bacterium]|nr:hypothetical protein EMGBS3_15900 [Anaerolineaceae bacterium]GBL36370.1 hypothetical protein EMGBD1_00570 [Anaerolineaceae bacterium]
MNSGLKQQTAPMDGLLFAGTLTLSKTGGMSRQRVANDYSHYS